MIYPYAHLSGNLAPPDSAVAVLKEIEAVLSASTSFEVKRAPFGYYKKFTITCKGHPLSELSRELVPGKKRAADEKYNTNTAQSVSTSPAKRTDKRTNTS